VGDSIPTEATNQNLGVNNLPESVGGWTLTLPNEDAIFYTTASNWFNFVSGSSIWLWGH